MAGTNLPVSAVADAYAQWRDTRAGNIDQIIYLMADEIEMRSVLDPELPDDLAAVRKTKAEARQYFEIVNRDWEMVDYIQDKIVADGDTIVWIGHCEWRHRGTGRQLHSPKVDIWTFRDGKAVSFLEMFDSLGFARTVGFV